MGRLPGIHFSLVLSMFVLISPMVASAAGITYHGRLIDPNGNPVVSGVVRFRLQIRTPGNENCLMYQEVHTRNMTSSAGTFAITIGDGTATTPNTEVVNGASSSLNRIFQNRGTYTFPAGKCVIDDPWTPNSADGRRLMVEFDDGGLGNWEPLPEQFINFVPIALETTTVGGFRAGELFRVLDGTSNPVSLTAWTQAEYNTLRDIVVNGVDWSDVTGKPASFTPSAHSHVVSDITSAGGAFFTYQPDGVECADGEVLKWTAANRWECAADDNTGSGLPAGLAGQFMRHDGADWVGASINLSDLKAADGDPLFDSPSCASNQTLSWSAVTDQFSCIGISLDASAITAGTLPPARLPFGTSNQVLGTNAAGDAAEFKSITAGAGVTINHSAGGIEISAAGSGGTVTSVTAGTNVSVTGTATDPVVNVASMPVDDVASGAGLYLTYKPNDVACNDGEVLKWQNSRWECAADAGGAGMVASVDVSAPLVNSGTTTDLDLSVADASTTAKGVVELATDGESAANLAVQANDSRLSDARTPTAHTHPVTEITSGAGLYLTYMPNNAECTDGQVLKWTAANRWECADDDNTDSGGTVTSVTAGTNVSVTGTAADPVINVASMPVDDVASGAGLYLTYKPNDVACNDGEVLKWQNSRWECAADDSGAAGTVTSVTAGTNVSVTGTATDPVINVTDASTTAKGVVELATDGESAANLAVQANDSRLSDARTPTAHTHGVDEVTSGAGLYLTYMPNNAECTDGQVLKWTAANRWECADDDNTNSGGTVTSVSAGTNVSVTGTAADPVVNVADASETVKGVVELATSAEITAGLVVQASDTRLSDARAPTGSAGGDLGGTYPNPDVVKLQGIAVSTTDPTTDQVLVYNGTSWAPATFGIQNLKTSIGGNQFVSASCTASQTLNWSAVTDAFSCVDINNLNADKITAGTFNLARMPAGSANQILGTNAAGNAAEFKSISAGTGIQINHSAGGIEIEATGGGGGDVAGPASSTDNALARFDLTTGKVIQNSNVTVDDAGNLAIPSLANFQSSGGVGTNTLKLYDTGGGVMLSASASGSKKISLVGSNVLKGINTTSTSYALNATNSADTSLLYVRNDGNVGIGTTSPSDALHVYRSSGEAWMTVQANANTAGLNIYSPYGSQAIIDWGTHSLGKNGDDSFFIWDNSLSRTALAIDTSGDMALMPSGGKVGVGVASPTAKLHVGGTAGVDGIRFPDGTLQTTAASGGGAACGGRQHLEVWSSGNYSAWGGCGSNNSRSLYQCVNGSQITVMTYSYTSGSCY